MDALQSARGVYTVSNVSDQMSWNLDNLNLDVFFC